MFKKYLFTKQINIILLISLITAFIFFKIVINDNLKKEYNENTEEIIDENTEEKYNEKLKQEKVIDKMKMKEILF